MQSHLPSSPSTCRVHSPLQRIKTARANTPDSPAAVHTCFKEPCSPRGTLPWRKTRPCAMATRCQFENSNDVGVFANLTNAYCLVALGASENFYR